MYFKFAFKINLIDYALKISALEIFFNATWVQKNY